MTKLIRAGLILIIISLMPVAVIAKTRVNVGLTSVLPPFVISHEKRDGLVYDLIDAFNQMQGEYEFISRLFPSKRLRLEYENSETHLVAFADLSWGWAERGGQGTLKLTMGRDLFVSAKGNMAKEADDTIGAVLGFHYAFADFDSEKLAQMSNVSLVKDEGSVLRLVVGGRVTRGIVSETLLKWYAVSRPEIYARLDIDKDHPDHTYVRRFIVLPASPIKFERVNGLLKELYISGKLKNIFAKYGLQVPENKEFLGL